MPSHHLSTATTAPGHEEQAVLSKKANDRSDLIGSTYPLQRACRSLVKEFVLIHPSDALHPAAATNNRVITRLHRQRRLVGDDPLKLVAVLSESALRRCARAGSVGHGQLRHLRERAKLPNVELHVLPFDLGLHAGQDGPFSLLSFPGQILPDMVYEENAISGRLTDTPSVLATFRTLFDEPPQPGSRSERESGHDREAHRIAIAHERLVMTLDDATWRTSSYTNSGSTCVEVADLGATRAVRDSKDPTGPVLRFTTAAWSAFTAGIGAGEFD